MASRQSPHYVYREVPRRLKELVRRRDRYTCQLCGDFPAREVDHIVPAARGGNHLDPAGLRVLCTGCNRRLGNITRDELRRERAAAAAAPRPDTIDTDGLLHHFNAHGQWETYRPAGDTWQLI